MKLTRNLILAACGCLLVLPALAFAQAAPVASTAPVVVSTGPVTAPAGIDIAQILADISQHNWLALILALAIYARFLFSAESKFPWTWHPNLRPIFFGLASALVVTMTAHDNGQAWGSAAGVGVLGLIGGGFLDSMVVALFGNTAAAPSWAKAIVGFIDSAVKNSSGGGGGTATAPVTPMTGSATPANGNAAPAAQRAFRLGFGAVALAVALGAVDVGCHESPQAAVAQAIDLTNYACAVADGQPAGQPYVELVCQILSGGEQLVSVIIGASSSPDGGVVAATASVPLEQVRIRMPREQVPAFLAAHKPLVGSPAPTTPAVPSSAPAASTAAPVVAPTASVAPAASSVAPAASSAPKASKKGGK
jgi:hypothetical protein